MRLLSVPFPLPLPSAALAVAAAVAHWPSPLAAQSWRTLDVARQRHDSSALRVEVEYGGGKLALGAAPGPLLYDMHLRYDATRTAPLYAYSDSARTLRLGVRKQEVHGRGGDGRQPAELRLGLAPTVPVDLSLEMGAVEADLDLSGLRLSSLIVRSGASDASVRFDRANVEPMRSLELRVGAASVKALRLANANAGDIRVRAGVGDVDLDMGGEWRRDVNLDVDVALGNVTVRVPSDVGVRVELHRLLAAFEHGGLVKREDAFYSDNWDIASRKLRIKAETTLGRFELDRR